MLTEALGTGLAIFAISASALLVTYRVADRSLQGQIRKDLRNVAAFAATTLDANPSGGVIAPGSPQSPGYRRAIEPLLQLRRTVPDLYYAYTLVPSNGGFRFGVDSSVFIRNPGDDTPTAQPGELYDDAPVEVGRAYRSGRVVVSSTPYTDKWGTFISAFAPLRDDEDRIVGLVGLDLSMRRLDGFLQPLRLTVILALAGSAALASFVGVGRWKSLRSREAAFREIAEAGELARQASISSQQANLAKDSFLATMSHEIRTPMNAIMGMAGLLHETQLDPVQKDYVEIIRNNTDSLLTIINDILDFSKIEAGSMELERQAFDLAVCLEEAINLMASRVRQKPVDLILDMDPGLPTNVIGDRTRLRQILWNLLSNAAKFTARGEIVVAVSAVPGQPTSMGSGQRWYRISVRDSGIGIPEERLPQLFEPFTQGDPSMARQYGGTGLGLAITRRLCALMGGTIEVSSRVGDGSCFSLTLPLEADPTSGSTSPGPALPAGARVLVLLPDTTLRRVLRRDLEAMGLSVTAADPSREIPARVADPADGKAIAVVLADGELLRNASDSGIEAWRSDRRWRDAPWILLLDRGAGGPAPAYGGAPRTLVLSRPLRTYQLRSALHRQLHPLSAASGTEPEAPGAVESSATTLAERLPLSILVVDDNPVNRKLALLLLKRLGYRADVAASGEEALRMVDTHGHDVVFMDVQMPGMDGYAATRAIRALPALSVQPWIIAMTAHARRKDREACLAAGMNDFVSKPIVPERLADALESYRPQPAVAGAPAQHRPATASGEETPPESIDPSLWHDLRTLMGDDADSGLGELIDLFLEDAPRLVSAVVVAQQNRDRRAMSTAVHALRSPSASLGANVMATLCRRVEDTLRSPSSPWPQQDINELLNECGRVSEALRGLRPIER
jgi:signal transduction histidine kinase/DNA-binding NarL/FixJ family response regulator/HPt (histidine-containing phosphotransfer) domain-containing protein